MCSSDLYQSQVDEPDETDVHLPPTTSSSLGRKELEQGSFYSSTQIDGSDTGAYLDDVASGPYGAGSINSIDSDRWRAINA